MKPILFTIGPYHVFAFGFFLALSFIFATYIIWKYGKEELLEEELLDTFVYTSLISLVSARVFYILTHFDEFGTKIIKYIVVREAPGLTLVGGLLGGAVFLYYFTHRKKLSFAKTADIFSIAASLSLSLVALGEFFGGGNFGKITTGPWSVTVAGLQGRRHPVEIYAFILWIILFVLLRQFYKSKLGKNKGMTSYMFLIGLSITFFLLEFFKESSLYLYKGLSFNQFFSIIIFIAALVPVALRLKEFYKFKKI